MVHPRRGLHYEGFWVKRLGGCLTILSVEYIVVIITIMVNINVLPNLKDLVPATRPSFTKSPHLSPSRGAGFPAAQGCPAEGAETSRTGREGWVIENKHSSADHTLHPSPLPL